MNNLKVSDFEDLGLKFIADKKGVLSFRTEKENETKGLIALFNTTNNLLWISADRRDYKPYATLVNSIQIDSKEELQWIFKRLFFRSKLLLSYF